MDEKLFWELIGELQQASYRQALNSRNENAESDPYESQIEAIRAKLQEWLEATEEHFADPPWMDPVEPLMRMSPEDRERIIEATIRAEKIKIPTNPNVVTADRIACRTITAEQLMREVIVNEITADKIAVKAPE